MGIVNVTPDSFSGDGVEEASAAVTFAVQQRRAGSDIVDIGGESTRPGHRQIDVDVEIRRIVPVLHGVRAAMPDAILSIDTYKAPVLRAARAAGADMLNSIWGLSAEMRAVAAELRMPVVIMHNQAEPKYEGDVMDEVLRFLDDAARRTVAAGIPAEHVIVDPGIGFGKTAEHNVRILRELARLPALGFPTLLGTSRKSTLGKLTGRDVGQRSAATAATTALAVQAGIDMVRVHDVAANLDAARVADAAIRGWRPAEWT